MQLEARYIANNEQPTGPADETLLFTQSLNNFSIDTRQDELIFELDRTLIVDQDAMLFTLTRLGMDVLDTYGSNCDVGQSGLIVETLNHNP